MERRGKEFLNQQLLFLFTVFADLSGSDVVPARDIPLQMVRGQTANTQVNCSQPKSDPIASFVILERTGPLSNVDTGIDWGDHTCAVVYRYCSAKLR
jgi:hypothetical protein